MFHGLRVTRQANHAGDLAGKALGPGLDRFGRRSHLARQVKQRAAMSRYRVATRIAFEQRELEGLFQRLDAAADGRLIDIQPF